ncbi:N-acetylglucosamine-6-phosphate deacetylase [Phragmitibacter flavus]|uniref:N-acetylglucosamine-6-phosphate deacetylase n=1 Tax=Phragmitibacter flavus TaxID=2576071 RepID=A0A5R8KI75_9BACT|nr:N-acetylglucosamine-6-phosphate deacetylase [Phragmitibacter flavus]TLD72014.1 N-acetylglucosamine-6-phosphate deacetylase [Phragmitibacter flavus]
MFDLQINGYAGADFNSDQLNADALHHACQCLEQDGVFGILATIITDDLDAMCRRLRNLVQLISQDPLAQKIIAGIHIEGPFISPEPGYVGAHPARFVKPAHPDDAKRLLEAAGDLALLVTLAPELDTGFTTTQWLTSQGICVAAGHCNPTLDILNAACDHGLRMFTHLGNGCPKDLHRHDNIIQRALSLHERLWICFIADGVHIEPFALKNYLRAAGIDRSILVTDAISAARLGPGRHTLGSWELDIGEDLVARSPDNSHFVGSTITWPRMQTFALDQLCLDETQLHQLTFKNPLTALGVAG